MLKQFLYQFNAGPLTTEKELSGTWRLGNCRRAIQFYFYDKFQIFLRSDEVLCPKAYHKTGSFIFKEENGFDFSKLQPGDVIYAEKIRDKKGNSINKSRKLFKKEDSYVIALHTGIYTGDTGKEIWHSTSIEGGSCYWSLEKFSYYYKPIAAKRLDFAL